MFLRNIGSCKSDTASHPRRRHSSRFFSSPHCPGRLWGPLTLLSHRCRWLFPGIKLPSHEADHSLPSSAEVKSGGTIFPLRCMSSNHTSKGQNYHRKNNGGHKCVRRRGSHIFCTIGSEMAVRLLALRVS
jgi:hypothetical protein